MNTKTIVAGILGGITHFVLGFLLYGLLLSSYLSENMIAGFGRSEDEMLFVHLVIAHILSGFFLAWIFSKTPGTNSFGAGLKYGGIIGFFMGITVGLELYAVSNIYSSINVMLVDLAAVIVLMAVSGAVVAWWLGRASKS